MAETFHQFENNKDFERYFSVRQPQTHEIQR
jgi:hypothetical protein